MDSKQAHTSFGKLPLSVERTAEAYQFPKAKRDEAAKLFLGELTKTDNAGKNSPGPVYEYQDGIKYDSVSKLIKLYLMIFFSTIGSRMVNGYRNQSW